MKRFSLFLLTLFFIACTSDSEQSEVMNQSDEEMEVGSEQDEDIVEEENQTELFSFAVQVNGNYFNESTIGKIYLSNLEGEILASEILSNNVKSNIEMELDSASEFDVTYYIQRDFGDRRVVEIKSFVDVSSGEYFLNAEEKLNGNGDNFIVTFLNTGFPLEEVNSFSGASFSGSENGGFHELETSLPNYPGSIYAAFLSPNDSQQKYYFGEGITRNSNFEIDYAGLPFVENEIDIKYPSDADIYRIRLNGFRDYANGVRLLRNVDKSEVPMDKLVFPNGIFDNYVLNTTLGYGTTSQRQYSLKHYGIPESRTFDLPDLEAQILSSEIEDFNMTSESEYDYSDIFYSFFDRENNSSFYTYNIYTKGSGNVVFSKRALLDNILAENLSVTSDRYRFNYISLTNNSYFGNDEVKLIQSTMEGWDEFPHGTVIESYRPNN